LAESLQIYNEDALQALLLNNAHGRFYKRYNYFAIAGRNIDIAGDVLRVMKTFSEPQNYEAIHKKLWYIPYDKMKYQLVVEKSIVNVASETYFYALNLPISADETRNLISVIRQELSYRSHITDVELMELIRIKCPAVSIDTEGFTTYGLRNALGYVLRDYFSFNGPIVSSLGEQLSVAEVYAEYCRSNETLRLEDLQTLSRDLNLNIYWDTVLNQMVRISDKEFVRRDMISFNVDAIDTVLEEMCPGDYVPIRDVSLFLHFPTMDYRWNSYVLESYVYAGSRKFELIHVSFSASEVCGAIVRRDSAIKDYRALIIDALAHSNRPGSKQAVLQYIVERGFQSRRRYDGIEQVIQEAKLLQEKLHKQKK
jgi:hypothetical protein